MSLVNVKTEKSLERKKARGMIEDNTELAYN